jgi:alpha-mannosidase
VVVDQTRQAPFYRVQTAVFDAWLRRDCGVIVSLIDKRSGQQRVGYGRRRPSDYVDTARPDLALGVLQVFDEAPHGMSAWQMHEVQREQSLIAGGTSRVLEQGPARIVIATEHQVRGSRIEQRTTFYPDLPRIDYQTRVDWHERGGPDVGVPGLKVAFTAALREAEAWFETPFAAAQRPADGQESVALRWAWVGGAEGGIAVVNDAKYGYDALGDRLRLTLLRSSYSPDHDPDSGSHVIRYALVPTLGHWRNSDLVHVAHGFNQPLIARTARPTTSRAEQRNDASVALALPEDSSVVLAGIKAAESCPDTLVARLYESAGRSSDAALDLPTGWRVSEANVLEEPIRSLAVDGRCLALRLRPWEVRTLLLHRPSVR